MFNIYYLYSQCFTLGLYPNNVGESVSWWVGPSVSQSVHPSIGAAEGMKMSSATVPRATAAKHWVCCRQRFSYASGIILIENVIQKHFLFLTINGFLSHCNHFVAHIASCV